MDAGCSQHSIQTAGFLDRDDAETTRKFRDTCRGYLRKTLSAVDAHFAVSVSTTKVLISAQDT